MNTMEGLLLNNQFDILNPNYDSSFFNSSDFQKVNYIYRHFINTVIADLQEKKERWINLQYPILFFADAYESFTSKDDIDKIIFNTFNSIKIIFEQLGMVYPISLFDGITELALSVRILNKRTGYYSKFLESIDTIIINTLPGYVSMIERNRSNLSVKHYDSILGVSGILAYLLCIDNRNVSDSIIPILSYFKFLSSESVYENSKVINFFIKPENVIEQEREYFSKGLLNLSLAHGLAGPLAVTALALMKGYTIEGCKEYLKKFIDIYFKYAQRDANGCLYWPGQLSLSELKGNGIGNINNKRMGWCYGSAGVLRALQLSARAIQDRTLEKEIVDQFVQIARIKIGDLLLDSPTLCHGYSGLISILHLVGEESGNIEIKRRVYDLFCVLLALYSPNSRYGFINKDYVIRDGKFKILYDDSKKILTGSTGVLLTFNSVLYNKSMFEKHLLLN